MEASMWRIPDIQQTLFICCTLLQKRIQLLSVNTFSFFLLTTQLKERRIKIKIFQRRKCHLEVIHSYFFDCKDGRDRL
jgi:hypothetical protein